MSHSPIHSNTSAAVADGSGAARNAAVRFDSLLGGIIDLGRRRGILLLTLLVLISLIGN